MLDEFWLNIGLSREVGVAVVQHLRLEHGDAGAFAAHGSVVL